MPSLVSVIFVQCNECTQKVALKTTIGRGEYEEFAFPCPSCGVELRYGVELDQVKANLAYVGFKNMEQVAVDEDAPVVRMDAAYLIPLDAPPLLSPFMATMTSLGDRAGPFLDLHKVRCDLPRNMFPLIARAKVHLHAGNADLFNRNAAELGYEAASSTPEALLQRYLEMADDYAGLFLAPNYHALRTDVLERCLNAQDVRPQLCCHLDVFFAIDDRADHCLEQLDRVRTSWSMNIAAILLPMYMAFEAALDLRRFALCQKRFDELRQFYIDVYETYCRVSTIAVALEGATRNGAVCIPKRRGDMTLAEYEVMPNGAKGNILKNLSVAHLFCPHTDSSLRNGVGHNSSTYKVNGDVVSIRNQNAKGISDRSMPFTEFCFEVLKAYLQLEAVAPYATWIYARSKGLKLIRTSGGGIKLSVA